MLRQFSNLSCYEEFEIQSTLLGISKIDILRKIGHQIDDYYFFISNNGIFNWFDLKGNHIEDPGILKTIDKSYIPKNITKCIIPNSVTNICNAFYSCDSLISINIPNGVTSIGLGTFSNCKLLKEITIPDSVTDIGTDAFYGCESLKVLTIPNSVKNIDILAFAYCKSLLSMTIPTSVTNIGSWAFVSCISLTSITIPNSVKSIGRDAFLNCKSLTSFIFKGMTQEEVQAMDNYPWDILDTSIIKCET